MKYSSETAPLHADGRGLGNIWAAVIPAAISAGATIFGTIRQDRAQDQAQEARQDARQVQLLRQQAAADVQQLRQTLPSQLNEQQARKILQSGAAQQRQQAEDHWRTRFSGLPNAVDEAQAIAEKVQQAYIDAARGVVQGAQIAGLTGWALGLVGVGLGGAAAWQAYQRRKGENGGSAVRAMEKQSAGRPAENASDE
jgi:hypothetical protein